MNAETSIIAYRSHRPRVHSSVYLARGACVIGRVQIGAHASIWFNSVLRADIERIRVGRTTNIQDLCLLHVDHHLPCLIGDEVVVGHQVTLHGCVVGDGALIGMGAIVLSGARVGDEALVGAGSVVPEGVRIPPRTLVMGIPARRVRQLTAAEARSQHHWAQRYAQLARAHRASQSS